VSRPPTICLMLKAPIPGIVKTRLARDIGPDAAVEAYRQLVAAQIAHVPRGWRAHVCFAPAAAEEMMRAWLGAEFAYSPQVEGDLGDRLADMTRRHFSDGGGALLFVGGDCPSLTAERLDRAARALDACDVAFIPSLDGGYCLAGMNACHPEIFSRIAWSTGAVLRETLARCREHGLSVQVLELALEDVDDLASWQRALASGSMQIPAPAETTSAPPRPTADATRPSSPPGGTRGKNT